MARVLLRNVTKVYDNGVIAVKGADFEVQDKEFVVLVGPSGCGKSTLLRMVAGLEEISGGDIYIGDKLVNNVTPKDRDIAMVFQNYALYPHMSVYENMAFGLKLRKYPLDEIERRVKEASDVLQLNELLARKPKLLSGGQRQRVAVGRAIVRKPQVFLFDEPLSNLDAKLRVQMRAEISKLHHRLQATMVYVTHDQVEAMTMGDRIVVMCDGLIMQIDEPLNLYDNPVNKFVAGFIGSPSMNFVEGHIREDNGFYYQNEGFRVIIDESHAANLRPYLNKPVIFGIRPEHLVMIETAVNESTNGFSGTIEVVEPMGHEVYVYVTVAGYQLMARLPIRKEPDIGSKMNFRIDNAAIHFFDAKTEQKIA